MPHLISVLQSSSPSGADLSPKQTGKTEEVGGNGNEKEKEGPTAKEQALERMGMEWGTVLVFTCRDNCCAGRVDDPGAKECWQEELVLVQWEE